MEDSLKSRTVNRITNTGEFWEKLILQMLQVHLGEIIMENQPLYN